MRSSKSSVYLVTQRAVVVEKDLNAALFAQDVARRAANDSEAINAKIAERLQKGAYIETRKFGFDFASMQVYRRKMKSKSDLKRRHIRSVAN